MNTAEVSLEQMLLARDERKRIQDELIKKYRLPVVSITMNIAGPQKRSRFADFAFNDCVNMIISAFGEPKYMRKDFRQEGCQGFLVYDLDAQALKSGAEGLEEELKAGRLLDIDVISPEAGKLSRREQRRCIICGGPVFLCSRSRKHLLTEIQEKTAQMLREMCFDKIAQMACQSLIEEARLTPKPGLVDERNNGAHSDMDLPMMIKSAECLKDYFATAAKIGYERGEDYTEKLQQAGIAAEEKMMLVSGGVNTHKGAVFAIGILCASAAAKLSGYGCIFDTAAEISSKLKISGQRTHGSIVRNKYGSGGARDEAAAGFPSIQMAVKYLNMGEPKLSVLLRLISEITDTNVLWRGGTEALDFLQTAAGNILSAPERDRARLVIGLDEECIRKNISPGGAADMFAGALLICKLETLMCDSDCQTFQGTKAQCLPELS